MSGRPLDGEILGPGDPDADHVGPEDAARVRRRFWPTFKKAFRQLPFAEDVVSAYYCAQDPDVPWRVRATLIAALVYFVSPVDAIPDVLAGVGFSDDVTVLAGAITMVASHITPRHKAEAREALAG